MNTDNPQDNDPVAKGGNESSAVPEILEEKPAPPSVSEAGGPAERLAEPDVALMPADPSSAGTPSAESVSDEPAPADPVPQSPRDAAPVTPADPGPVSLSPALAETRPLPQWLLFAFIISLAAAMFVLRLTGAPNLTDQDQERPTSYVIDVLRNHAWIVQRDEAGFVTSKPPLYTWAAALCSLPEGQLSFFSLFLPGALAVLGCALLLLRTGTRALGTAAGFWAALAFLLSMPAIKMVALARTDSLFTFTVFLTGLAGFICWTRGSNWIVFWLAALAATMTKGPLGLVLGALGLLAIVWEKATRQEPVGSGKRGFEHGVGVAIYLFVGVGWFLLAWCELGRSVADKLIGDELLRQAVRGDNGESPLQGSHLPILYFLSRFAPWSLLACTGMLRAVIRPDRRDGVRRLERFLTVALAGGILIFSFSGHKRPDHMFALLPFAALLAGRELALLSEFRNPRRYPIWGITAVFVFLGLSFTYYHFLWYKEERVKQTVELLKLGNHLKNTVGPDFPLTFWGAPYTVQFPMNTLWSKVTPEQADRLLAQPDPAYVLVRGAGIPTRAALPEPPSFAAHQILSWPPGAPPSAALVRVLSNRPSLEPTTRAATYAGPFLVRLDHARIDRVRLGFVGVTLLRPDGWVSVTNDGTSTEPLRLECVGGKSNQRLIGQLAPGDSARLGGVTPATFQERDMTTSMHRQIDNLRESLKGQRVGLITNPTGVDDQYKLIADTIARDGQTTVVCFFSPEHGLRGDQQAGAEVADYTDPVTSKPVYALYGVRTAPTDEQLSGVDTLVFDIQDVGARFYTYTWTMTHAMEAAAKNGKRFVVFDRPNPLGGEKVEGAPIRTDAGLIGRVWPGKPFGVATRYGLTIGELARLVNGEWLEPKANLEVIAMPDYSRSMDFVATGRPWVAPSPNMPTLDTALVYPGMCVFEGTNLSEGRGTTRPFEVVGAPFVDGQKLAETLNRAGLPGVRFRPLSFTPTFSKQKGEACGGVQVHVTDREAFLPVRTGLTVLKAVVSLYPDKAEVKPWAGKLMGVDKLEDRIRTESVEAIEAGWKADLEAFRAMRAKYLLYPGQQ